MLPLPVAMVEALVEEGITLRYIEHRPLYQLLATYLNGHGGKDPKAKKLPKNRQYVPEELMPPQYVPPELRPLRFTESEALAILDALPHLKNGGNWVLQAIVNRVQPLDQIQAATGLDE